MNYIKKLGCFEEGLDTVKLAYVYASSDYDLETMLKGIEEELPNVPLIGNTSFSGVITREGYIHGAEGFVGIMAVSDPDMRIGVAAVEKGSCPVEAGEKAARLAMENAGKTGASDYYYMTAPPGLEEFYVKGTADVYLPKT